MSLALIIALWLALGIPSALIAGVHQTRAIALWNLKNPDYSGDIGPMPPGLSALGTLLVAPLSAIVLVLLGVALGFASICDKLAKVDRLPEIMEARTKEADRLLAEEAEGGRVIRWD